MLHSSDRLHHPPKDDDRREGLAQTFEKMALEIRRARPETGLD